MKQFAVTAAIFGFFAMAAVGLACGVPTFDCALRALGGAVVVYVLVNIIGKIVLNIMIETLLKNASREGSGTESKETLK